MSALRREMAAVFRALLEEQDGFALTTTFRHKIADILNRQDIEIQEAKEREAALVAECDVTLKAGDDIRVAARTEISRLLAEIVRLREVIAGKARLDRSSVGPHAVARVEALEDAAKKCEMVATRLPGPASAGASLCASEIRAMIGGG